MRRRRTVPKRRRDQAPLELAPILLSVVTPLKNTEGRTRAILEPIVKTLAGQVEDFELVVVDNGSTDNSEADYVALAGEDGLPNLQVYRLIRAVDIEVAIWAGVENSLGDFVLVFDPESDDLTFLPQALDCALGGADLVAISNTVPKPMSAVERLFEQAYRRLFRAFVGVDLAREGTQCRLISKRLVGFLMQQPNPALRYRSLPSLAGFPKAALEYAAPRPAARRTSLRSKLRRAANLLFAQTLLPLRMASGLAVAGATLNLIYTGYVILVAVLKSDVQPGWTTLSLQQSGMFFLLSLVVFVLVEYVAQMMTWTFDGPAFYMASEYTSSLLTRRNKLNVAMASTERPIASDERG